MHLLRHFLRLTAHCALGAVLLSSAIVLASDQPAESAAVSEDTVLYAELDPTFVANVGSSDGGRLAYVKTDVSLQVKGPAAQTAVQNHKVALRNILVLAISRQDAAAIGTLEGRDQLKAEALKEIQTFLEAEEDRPMVEDLLFTNFIVQL